jgi:N utilization substance protein A
MDELNGEKIDIVDYDEDPAKFVAHALAPAKVSSVTIVDELYTFCQGCCS